MTEVTENFLPVQQEERLLIDNSSELPNLPSNLTSVANDSSDDENGRTSGWGVRRRIKRFSDSDSDNEADKENIQNVAPLPKASTSKPDSSSESDEDVIPRKSRIRDNSGSSEDSDKSKSPRQEESRIGNKRNKLHQKFKGLLQSRSKAPETEKAETSNKLSSEGNGSSSSDSSSSGIESIKKKIKQKSMILKSSICDPDISSDEDGRDQQPEQKKKKPKQRTTILTSPKPARMSAKQAMENMQKIKSESNRMLREKEVSLPYHRSKALSLKDIMSRRKLAVSADGKALPVKMNSDQLKQYVKLLEQRNKEMMELCKSDTEDEEVTETAKVPNTLSNADDCKESGTIGIIEEQMQENTELPEVNLTEKANKDDELADLIVEIVQKEHDNSNTDIPVNNDADMKEISDDSLVNSEFKIATEDESQLIKLHYETEKTQNTEALDNVRNPDGDLELNKSTENVDMNIDGNEKSSPNHENPSALDSANVINEKSFESDNFSDDFSDTDINMEDIDKIIENAKNNTSEDIVNSPMLIKDFHSTNLKPKLTGAPGMVIDLDGSNPVGPKKLTGVELLKERFTYFAKLKTPEEMERERELKLKPGMQHLKLRQELEEQISEQRSLEWAKRLADDKQHQLEMDAIRGDESDQEEIEKIEAQLEEKEDKDNTTSESEEEVDEICDKSDKPRKRNPMIDDEAEVSGDDDGTEEQEADDKVRDGENNGDNEEIDSNDDDKDQDDSEESSDETSEDEEDKQSKPRKGRILKAFEDSDDESTTAVPEGVNPKLVSDEEINESATNYANETQYVKYSQDDVLPLAQTNKTNSEDFFASQTSNALWNGDKGKLSDKDSSDLGTQTFSILNPKTSESSNYDNILNVPDKLDIISETQPVGDVNLDEVVGMCSGKFTQTQNLVQSESQITQSQCAIGDDILELCTGNFYENKFVTQTQNDDDNEITKEKLRVEHNVPQKKIGEEKDLLDSILKEMEQPAAVNEAPKKYTFDNANTDEPVSFDVVHQIRKKFTIDSDDEGNEATNPIKKKKLKKRRPEKRALQISDDEEEEEQLISDEDAIDDVSDVDDDGEERIVEYDSEENEVVVKPQNQKKKRKMAEFFEQEAELTSEDEWVGSGDEDEAGLDRMEREAGDDDTFHEGQLQRELGQIHMRDVLDQDKREVRLIQELLFEDGDLGEGHRQRKFRWKNLDGEEETDAVPDMFGESQEEEFESEEQWRKQRHEREMFLRNLKKENETEDHNISIDRSTIIKANLCSKTMSSLLLEVNGGKIDETTAVEKIVAKEDPVPAATISVFPQSYHGSLLTRGRGALARLAALAMPLAGDADDARAVGPSTNRNFVFTSVTPDNNKPKVAKRKAEDSGTPKLIKKLKTDGKQKFSKYSLLDHLKAL